MERKLEKEVKAQTAKAHAIDAETQAVLDAIHHKDRRMRFWATTLFLILFGVGTLGIFYQNKLAQQNRNNGLAIVNYLDCIGHINKPVAERRQADYDKCLNDMRKAVQNN